MATQYIRYGSGSGGAGVSLYPTFANFPVSATEGTLALALDTDILYVFDGSWIAIGGPGSMLAIGTLDGQSPSADGATIASGLLYMQTATSGHVGLLTAADWTTFNSKQAAGSYITSLTGDVTASGPGAAAATIASGVVSNAKLATMPTLTFKGNITGGTAAPVDLTVAQMKTALSLTGSNSGDVTLTAIGSSPNVNAASLSGQALTLQPAGAGFPGVLSATTQTISGSKTFPSAALFQSGIILPETGALVDQATIVAPADISASYTWTLPAAQGAASTLLNNDGSGNLTWVASSSVGTSGVTTMAAIGSTPNANGASISSTTLTLQPASATFGGIITTGTQSFTGSKTFGGTTAVANFKVNGITGNTLPTLDGSSNLVASLVSTDEINKLPTKYQPNSLENYSISCSVSASALTINLLTANGSALAATSDATARISVRNGTAATGKYNEIDKNTTASIVIPSGATLGLVSGSNVYIYVYLQQISSSGVDCKLAVSSIWRDELSVATTTSISAAATDSGFYATAGVASQGFRLIARLKYNTAPNGTYSSVPDEISLNSNDAAMRPPTPAAFVGCLYYWNSSSSFGVAAGSVPSATTTIIDYNVSVLDPDSAVTTGASWKYTVPANKGGKFKVDAGIEFVINPTTSSFMIVYVNGAIACYSNQYPALATGGSFRMSSRILDLVAADTVDVRIFQRTGTNQVSDSSGAGNLPLNYISIARIST